MPRGGHGRGFGRPPRAGSPGASPTRSLLGSARRSSAIRRTDRRGVGAGGAGVQRPHQHLGERLDVSGSAVDSRGLTRVKRHIPTARKQQDPTKSGRPSWSTTHLSYYGGGQGV